MENETTRRGFMQGGAVAAAGILVADATASPQQPEAQHIHSTHATEGDYPRDRPSAGGPLGSATDRGMLVPGLVAKAAPPVPVTVPDLPQKLAWTMVRGAKEFHLHCMPVKREF